MGFETEGSNLTGRAEVCVTDTDTDIDTGIETDADTHRTAADDQLQVLLQRSGTGDADAFAQLYDLTCARVFGSVLRIVRDAAQSEEVTQDVYLDLWTHANRYDPTRSPAIAYLLMHARSRAITRVRSAEATTRRDDAYARRNHERDHDETSETALGNVQASRVRALLAQLGTHQQEAISLAYLQGRTHTQVAADLGTPLGTVKSRIRDGLLVLRGQLAPR
jgi:RNA polymerase sigma-70 factor (ECF subfamily)